MLELKLIKIGTDIIPPDAYNRTMLELKQGYESLAFLLTKAYNRTMLELKRIKIENFGCRRNL